MMVDEVYWGDRKTASIIPAQLAILDGGATMLMSGSETIEEYLTTCHARGYPIETPEFHACRRPFRFGNGKVEHALRCGVIPASFKSKTGTLYIYLVPGKTPTLFPRPLLEKFAVQ
eukprot:575805-Pyramimonas_sp.AAC.1